MQISVVMMDGWLSHRTDHEVLYPAPGHSSRDQLNDKTAYEKDSSTSRLRPSMSFGAAVTHVHVLKACKTAVDLPTP